MLDVPGADAEHHRQLHRIGKSYQVIREAEQAVRGSPSSRWPHQPSLEAPELQPETDGAVRGWPGVSGVRLQRLPHVPRAGALLRPPPGTRECG